MNRVAIVYFLFLIAAVLGLSTINVNHHVNLPQEVTSTSRIHHTTFWNFAPPFIHVKTDIQMADEIKGPNTVRDINAVLNSADEGDIIVFHLAGYGGSVESVLSIVSNIRSSKAEVIMSVEAPVYSGHAYLAVLGHKLIMADNAYLMFHTSSGYNTDCSKETGVDRNMTNQEHCEAMKAADNILVNRVVLSMQHLTLEEKLSIIDGKDVYLDSVVVNARLIAGL